MTASAKLGRRGDKMGESHREEKEKEKEKEEEEERRDIWHIIKKKIIPL